MYRGWLEHRGLSLKEGRQTTLAMLPRIFDRDVLPTLGKRSIYEIKRPDLLEVIAKIEKRRAPPSPRKSGRGSTNCSATRW